MYVEEGLVWVPAVRKFKLHRGRPWLVALETGVRPLLLCTFGEGRLKLKQQEQEGRQEKLNSRQRIDSEADLYGKVIFCHRHRGRGELLHELFNAAQFHSVTPGRRLAAPPPPNVRMDN